MNIASPPPKKGLRGVSQEGLVTPDSDGVARPFCRRRGEGRWAELRKCPPSPATPSPPVALGFPVWGGWPGPPVSRVIFTSRRPVWAPDPAVRPRGSSRGRRPGPAPPRAGAAGMFSPPRGAASCPPCWKPIPVTDSGPLRSGGGRVSRGARRGGPGGLGIPAGGRLAPPTPALRGRSRPAARGRPSPRRRPGCVTRWRPRGPGRVPGVRGGGGWGGGGKRHEGSGLHRVPRAGGRVSRSRCGGRRGRSGRGAGLEVEPREEEAAGGGRGALWGRRARVGDGGDTFWVEAVPEGRVGYPAGTRLPGHEFLCHRNLISCQVLSRLRLSGFHSGPFLLAARYYEKKSSFCPPPAPQHLPSGPEW